MPRDGAPSGNGAFGRWCGAMGKAWRLHANHGIPEDLLQAHTDLLCRARAYFLPHLVGGGEAEVLLDMLARLAGCLAVPVAQIEETFLAV